MVVERLLDGMELAVRRKALDRRDLGAVAWTPSSVQDFADSPSTSTVHAPHDDVSHPTFVPVRPSRSRRT